MTWSVLLPIILQYGIPTATRIFELWQTKRDQPVTPEELAELVALSKNTPVTQMADALNRAGIDPNSEQGKALLSLVSAPKLP